MDEDAPNHGSMFHIDQKILITAGPFAGMEGVIYLIDRKAGIAKVKISFFGRPTPVELPLAALKALDR